MDRVTVFVDAGYFFAQGSALLTGKKTPRGEISVDIDKTLAAFEEFACRITKVPLLRIYWYDGTSTGPTPQHVALAFKPNVKVRLGFVNTVGQQKGVDSLIVTDMITLARNRVMSDAVLLSGDEDVRVGVQQAQEFGVRVHLLGIAPARGSQSLFLLQEADTTHEWGKKEISVFLSHRKYLPALPTAAPPVTLTASPLTAPSVTPIPTHVPTASHATAKTFDSLATEAASEIDPSVLDGLIKNYESTGMLPPTVDRPLIGRAGRTLGRMDQKQIRELRLAFVSAMKHRLPPK
jgi:uncharacterized LabA/DUF88 family protein